MTAVLTTTLSVAYTQTSIRDIYYLFIYFFGRGLGRKKVISQRQLGKTRVTYVGHAAPQPEKKRYRRQKQLLMPTFVVDGRNRNNERRLNGYQLANTCVDEWCKVRSK